MELININLMVACSSIQNFNFVIKKQNFFTTYGLLLEKNEEND